MRTEHVKFELETLLRIKRELLIEGRNLEYVDAERIETLRAFLDGLMDDPKPVFKDPTDPDKPHKV